MKFDWDNWNVGGKLIFLNACLAFLSMFMNWVDIGIAARTGMQNGAVLCLGLWIYPVVMLLRNKPINLGLGLLCAAVSFVFVSIYLIDATSRDVFGESFDVSAIGAWVFLVASFFLGVGIIKYTRPDALWNWRATKTVASDEDACGTTRELDMSDNLLPLVAEQKDDLKSAQNRSLLMKVTAVILVSIGVFVVFGVFVNKLDYDYCVEQIEYGDEYSFCSAMIGFSDKYLYCIENIDFNRKSFSDVNANWLNTDRTKTGGYLIPFTAMNSSGNKVTQEAVCDEFGRLLEITY